MVNGSNQNCVGKIVQNGTRLHDLFSAEPGHGDYWLRPVATATLATDGTIVLAQLEGDQAHIVQCLAVAGSAQARLYQIASEHSINPLFPAEVMDEVETLLANPGLDDITLRDLTPLAFCTVDGATTRDLDQALYIESRPDAYRVRYAIADAAWYIRPGSALFAEALRRGASYYLPGLSIPMLPAALSEGLISLNAGVERRALVFDMQLDEAGQCVATELYQARIRSRAKLSFEQVLNVLNGVETDDMVPNDAALVSSLRGLAAVGELRLRERAERDVVRFRRREVEVKLGADGSRFVVLSELRNAIEHYNEQLSLLCNVEGAQFLLNHHHGYGAISTQVQPIYRVHPAPPPQRLAQFEQLTAALVEQHALDPAIWRYRQAVISLADYLEQLPLNGPQSGVAQAIQRQAVMLNVRSSFSAEPGRHYGVGAEVYARFSAPMREIVGIFLHKETLEKLSGTVPDDDNDEQLRDQVIAAAERARTLQNQITKAANQYVLDQLFGDDLKQPVAVRPTRTGTLIGLGQGKLYIVLTALGVEVKVYWRDLEAQFGEEETLRLVDEVALYRQSGPLVCALGDTVTVTVIGHKRGVWQFALVGSI